MKTEQTLEIIEVIDDDDDIFSLFTSTPATQQVARNPRWAVPAAMVVTLALMGYGVVSSASSADIAIPTTPGVIDTAYYAAEAPAGFAMYLAEARDDGGSNATHFIDPDSDAGMAELWGTKDATATTGSWFVVSRGALQTTGRNAYRQVVDGIEVLIEHDPASRQTRLSFAKNGVEMGITALGWLDRQLVRLVRSVNLDNAVIGFSDGFFTSDHRRLLRADPAAALFGVPVTRVGYTTGVPTELAQSFTITVGGDAPVDRAQVLKFALTRTSSFTAGATPGIVGESAADPTVSIAQWHDGERLITIRGNLDAQRLAGIAKTVHEIGRADVRRMLESATPPVVPAMQVTPRTVVSGMLADGWGWAIQVSARDLADPGAGYLWWIGQPGDTTRPSETRPTVPGDKPSIDTFVEHGRTYVLATVPRSMAGAELRVSPTGQPSISTPLHDVDSSFSALFAASVFTEPVTFTARILDADGNAVASWPPLRGNGN